MYKARHAKPARHRVTLPMLVLIAALFVGILVFPTPASGAETTPDAVSGGRGVVAQNLSSTYSSLPSAQQGGSVSPFVSDSAAGETVTFTVEPDAGYETAGITAITSGGALLEVLRISGETYRFTMPAESVIIDVAFQYVRV